MKKNCDICIESFNENKLITCFNINCKLVTCKKCINYYIINTPEEAHCMSCKSKYSMKFMHTMKLQSKEYNDHLKQILFDKECALLPQTQIFIENNKDIQINILNNKINNVKKNIYKSLIEFSKAIDYDKTKMCDIINHSDYLKTNNSTTIKDMYNGICIFGNDIIGCRSNFNDNLIYANNGWRISDYWIDDIFNDEPYYKITKAFYGKIGFLLPDNKFICYIRIRGESNNEIYCILCRKNHNCFKDSCKIPNECQESYNNIINDYKKFQQLSLEQRNFIIYDYTDKEKTQSINLLQFHCPNDDCKYFLKDMQCNNSNLECTNCNIQVCRDCHEIKMCSESPTGLSHVCLKENIQNVKYILKNTKNCPGCNKIVYKDRGCDHMFCIMCGTAFNWSNLKITITTSSPDIQVYLKNSGNYLNRNPDDILCGRDLDNNFRFNLQCKFRNFLLPSTIDDINYLINKIVHINNIDKRMYLNNNQDNQDLRINYLFNKITEKQFKTNIKMRHKKNSFNDEMYSLLSTFYQCATNLFYNLEYNFAKYKDDNNINCMLFEPCLNEFKQELITLINIINKEMRDICINYSYMVKYINEHVNFVSGYRIIREHLYAQHGVFLENYKE